MNAIARGGCRALGGGVDKWSAMSAKGLERMKRLVMFGAAIVILGGLYSLRVGAWSPHVESGAWAWIQPVSDQPPVSMVVERDGATAVLLPGGRVLIAGGANAAGEPTNNVELFDQSGVFFAAMPMHIARAHHSATLLKSGLVLVVGGTTTDGVATATAEIYDPGADSWADAGSLPTPRSGHTATLLQDGQHVLIAGGETDGTALASMMLYTDGLGFSAAGSLSAPRAHHATALLNDGRVLLVGGTDGTQPLASSDVFDPADWTFGPGPAMSAKREGLTATALLNGQVVVIGGWDGSHDLASAERFNPASGIFEAIGSSLSSARRDHIALRLPNNNSVAILGGTSSGSPVVTAELFRPWTSSFVSTGFPHDTRAGASASALATDGLLLVAGGVGSRTAELYGFATIKTDKDDYAPGETVTITGSGWVPGETVALGLLESPLLDTHPLLPVVADANGNIVSTEFSPDEHDLNIRFNLTAYGSSSEAQNTFTDAKPNKVTLNPASVTVAPGGMASYTVTIEFNGNSDSCTSPLSVSTPLPTGATAAFSPSSVTSTGADQTSTLTITTTGATPIGTTTFTVLAANGGGTCGSGTANGTGTLVVAAKKVGAVSVGAQSGSLTYGTAGSATYAVTVNRASAGGSFSADLSLTTPLPAGATGSFSPSTVSFASADTSKTSTLTISTSAATPAGSTAFTVQAQNPAVTGDSSTGAGTLLVGKRTVTPAITANSRNYDGTATATLASQTLSGVLAGDTANVTLNVGTASFDTKHVGTGKTVTATGLTLSGSAAGNYQLSSTTATTTAGISALALTVTAATNTKPYDGTNSAAATPTVTSGAVQTGDTANFTETYDTKNAGTGKTLTPSGTVTDGNGGSNYTYTFANDTTGVITARNITVKAASDTKVYDGGTSSSASPTITPALVGGDTSSFIQTFDTKHVGTGKTLTPSGSVNDGNTGSNYTVTFTPVTTGTITAKPVTVSAVSDTKVYDGNTTSSATPAIAPALVGGDTSSFLQAFDTKHVGAGKTLTPSGSVNDGNTGNNYTVTFSPVSTGTITAKPITVKAVSDTKTYDGSTSSTESPTITPSLATGDTSGFTQAFGSRNAGTAKTIIPSGSAVDGNSGGNYSVTFVNDTTGVINPLSVTPHITAHNKIYDGTAVATLSGQTALGVLPADEANVSLTVAEAHFNNSSAGTGKTVTATGLALTGTESGNYVLSYTTATTTADISPRPASVTPDPKSKTYGDADPAFTGTLTNFVAGDTVAASYSRTAGETVAGGPYTISATLSPAGVLGNYDITYNTASFTIAKRIASVTPQANTKTYGDADPALTGTLTNFVASDSVTASYSRTAGDTVAGSPYTISATLAPAGVLGNYDVTYGTAAFTISARAASWTTNPASKTYGDADPAGVTTGSGGNFVAADNVTASYSRASGETVAGGPYHITATLNPMGVLGNYVITNGGADFTITARAITVTTDAGQKKVYGEVDPSLTYQLTSGTLVGTDSLSGSLHRATGESVGSYAIDQGSLSAGTNYSLSFVGSNFSITPATLSVTADHQTKVYGANDPTLTYHASGFKFSDTAASVLSGALSRVAGETVAGGPYPIGQGALASNANYTMTFTGNALEISTATLMVTANHQTKTYGDVDPALTYSASGFKFSDTAAAVITGALGRAPGETVTGGPYALTQNTLAANANYTIAFASNTLDITKRPVSVKADHQTKMLNAPDPAFTHQITSGSVVFGDTFAGSLTRDAGEAIGTYPIKQGTLGLNGNYNLTFTGDTLDIVFLSSGLCQGQPGHQVLQPIDTTGTSVFKQKSTVPVKFRVCDANGNSVGTPNVVKSFYLVQTVSGTVVTSVNEDVASTTPDTTFRFDTSDRQWIFNLNTKSLNANMTYVYRVTLADNSVIQFQFGLK